MTPMMDMPVLRQIRRTPEGPWWRRALWWLDPVVYEVAEDFDFPVEITPLSLTVNLVLPAGFRCDLASTPRLSWLFGFRPDGLLLLPGLYHDFWYRHGFIMFRHNGVLYRVYGGKSGADGFFLHLLLAVGCPRLSALAAFFALRLFGRPAWWANAKYREEAARQTDKLQLHGDY